MQMIIRGMVCRHCVAALKRVFDTLGIAAKKVEIGRAELTGKLSADELAKLDEALAAEGFERVADADAAIVEGVRHAIGTHARTQDQCHLKLSACVEQQVGMNYDTVSRIFSRLEGRTIEQYHILQKVEYVKELLASTDDTLEEIADKCGYSGASHLARQFKSITGMTPGQYRRTLPPRPSLEKI